VTPGVDSCELQVAFTSRADTTFMVGAPKPIVVVQRVDFADARAFRKVAEMARPYSQRSDLNMDEDRLIQLTDSAPRRACPTRRSSRSSASTPTT
jgi:hypothetical protein